MPYIAGLGKAAAIARAVLPEEAKRLARLRDLLLTELSSRTGPVLVSGHAHLRLPNTLNISIPGVPGFALPRGNCLAVTGDQGDGSAG